MGLMEAMRYPDDYDGIIAGAPYMDNHTELWGYKNAKAFLKAHVTPEVVAKVNEAVLATCDADDGAKDGLIQNPGKCSFDPQSLVPATLTQAQADAFKIFMAPVTDSHGRTIYPGSPISDSQRRTDRRGVSSAGSSPQRRRPIPPRPSLGARRRRC